MDDFKKYGSIENATLDNFIKKIMEDKRFDMDQMKFVATEKVHGANFSFTVIPKNTCPGQSDNDESRFDVKVGKRSKYLDSEESMEIFFKEATLCVLNKYKKSAIKMYNILENKLLNHQNSHSTTTTNTTTNTNANINTNDISNDITGTVGPIATPTGSIITNELKHNTNEFDGADIKISIPEDVIQNFVSITKVVIFGELFGGCYPHPDVESTVKSKAIQKGLYYSPNFEFYAFDVYVEGIANKGTRKGQCKFGMWINYDEAINLFKLSGFDIYATPLKIGTFKELLEMDVRFPTKIPEMFFPHLPKQVLIPIKQKRDSCNQKQEYKIFENISEGVVIKPWQRQYYLEGGDRLIIKKKNTDYIEVMTKKNRKEFDIDLEKIDTNSPNVIETWKIVKNYMTNQRLNNVQSKIGNVIKFHSKEHQQFVGMFTKDVLQDFLKDHNQKFLGLDQKERKEISKNVANMGKKLVHNYIIKENLSGSQEESNDN